jgi:hypothetical protein
MRLKPEHVEVLKDQLKGAIETLTPDQVIRLGFGMFAVGAVAAEVLLNAREARIKAREERIAKLDKGPAKR